MLLVAVALTVPACSGGNDAASGTVARSQLVASTIAADFTVRGSVGQIFVTGAKPGTPLAAYDSSGRRRASGTSDALGSLVFRRLPPGRGYRVQVTDAHPAPTSNDVRVMSVANSQPPESFYRSQTLHPGFQYITTRDGTTLSAAVYLPGPIDKGPYPTVVEYSGYSPSNPTKSLENDLKKAVPGADTTALCKDLTFLCTTPDQPASELAAAMGYAVVAVNMRGTGCSGGAYDFFETNQVLDGYDVIETAAAQPWVANGKVGMVGISYPAIAQLFVAQTRPPHLAAIAPLSVFDDTVRGVLAPGGILNEGFTLQWAQSVLDDAKPYGQAWTKKVAAAGDATCAANQKMRLQNVDAVAEAKRYPYYVPAIADPLNPTLFVDKIHVPVFLACAFEDEQTGGRCAHLADRFTGAPVAKFTFYNGAHADGFAPQVLVEWKTFLDLYVAKKLTPIDPRVVALAPQLLKDVFGVAVAIPPQRWLQYSDYESAKKAFEAEEPVRVIYESGAGSSQPGAPVGRYEARYKSWPIPGTTAQSWYLQPDGTMSAARPPGNGGASRFTFDAALGHEVTLPGADSDAAFKALPAYDWAHDKPGDAAVFVSAPLTRTTTMSGTGNADLWIAASATDVDLSATLSEVRPDGKETYVQSGWLRSSFRKLAPGSTELDPEHTGYRTDAEQLPSGKFVEAQLEIFPFAHVFRAGSRIRISVHTPGGDRPRWSWILPTYSTPPTIDVGHDAAHPSRLILPVVTDAPAPATLPACPSLRGQPCRSFQPYTNQPTPVS
jgi:predicted acyl esterase